MAFIHCLILNIVNQCPIAGHVPINSENRPILRLKSAGHRGIDTLKGPKQCRSNTGAVGFVPGLYLVCTWSIPGLYLVGTWSLEGDGTFQRVKGHRGSCRIGKVCHSRLCPHEDDTNQKACWLSKTTRKTW